MYVGSVCSCAGRILGLSNAQCRRVSFSTSEDLIHTMVASFTKSDETVSYKACVADADGVIGAAIPSAVFASPLANDLAWQTPECLAFHHAGRALRRRLIRDRSFWCSTCLMAV